MGRLRILVQLATSSIIWMLVTHWRLDVLAPPPPERKHREVEEPADAPPDSWQQTTLPDSFSDTGGGLRPVMVGAAAPIPVVSEADLQPAGAYQTWAQRLVRVARSHVVTIFWVTVALAWFLTLRPVAWGGPAGYNIVAGLSMQPTLQPGDLVLTNAQSDYSVGQVIAYHVPAGNPAAGSIVVHRIIGGDAANGFVTKGDNVSLVDPWRPKPTDVIGQSWGYIPGVGRVLLTLRTPVMLATVLALVGGLWFYFSGPAKQQGPPAKHGRLIGVPILRRSRQPVPMGMPQSEPVEPLPR